MDETSGGRPDLTIVIVTYQVRPLVLACLESVRAASKELRVDVHLVENGNDGTAEAVRERFPEVAVHEPGSNLGFVRGNNMVLDTLLREGTAGRYVLLLNPDTVVRPDTFSTMVAFMDGQPEAGAATCRVDLASGGLDWACHRGFPAAWPAFTHFTGLERLFPRSRVFGRYHLTWLNLRTTHEIDSPTGAFFLVRREAFEDVGALDIDYVMYGEDLDWAYRIKAQGWRVVYHPGTRIVHHKGASSGLKGFSKRVSRANAAQRSRSSDHFSTSMRIFYERHLAAEDPAVLRLLVRGGIEARRWAMRARFAVQGALEGLRAQVS